MTGWRRTVASVGAVVLLAGCAATSPVSSPSPGPTSRPGPTPTPAPTAAGAAPTPAEPSPGVTTVRYRVEVRAEGLDPSEVTATVQDVLTDPRGWVRAGYVFELDPGADVVITVAEGAEIDRRCAPYDTSGRYSCQLGRTVNLNADRWRTATPTWTGDLAAYRVMLVNHEVGHLIGLHHPSPQCPGEGYPAPIMMQQSTELGACTANPWPLAWEIELAASGVEPFAPGYEPDPAGRPTPPPVRS